ncbi:hypothetical protein K439DRAFT_1627287 [Ramaria rubella]|nr:hypothetical protein K439DRAFT_1627287 [Ramaria rubella]
MHSLTCRGFSAWITIEGEPIPVYKEETTEATCRAWIPSTVGKTFSVWWKDDSKTRIATSGHVFIDGHDVASAIMRPGRSKPVERMGAKTSARRLKPFRFSVLRLTDDDTIANQNDPGLKDMGTIKIEISRVKLGGEVPFKGYEAQEHGLVHEKAKKLGAHCIAYDPSKRTVASRTVAVTTAPYDINNPGPYVTFVFNYRSEDLLLADGIIDGNNNNKRKSPDDDDEVIVISDSEDDNDKQAKSGEPAKKRSKVETEVGPSSSQQSSSAEGAGEANEACATDSEDLYVNDNQMEFGAPSSLLQGAEKELEESQTQPDDDVELNFGAPSLLQGGSNLRDGEAPAASTTSQEADDPAPPEKMAEATK